jgi:Holliday junction resolvase
LLSSKGKNINSTLNNNSNSLIKLNKESYINITVSLFQAEKAGICGKRAAEPVIRGDFMARYAKGANAERELMGILWNYGFAVARAAGSGKSSLPCPDMIAVKGGKITAFECKAWKGKHLSITPEQMDELVEWCRRAEAGFYIAWKMPRMGWLLIAKSMMSRTEKAYVMTAGDALKKGLRVEALIHKKLVG